jgi:hypothetical protein
LALGVAIGTAVNPSTVGPIGNENGTLVAQGALAHALDTQLASAAPAATGPQIGITFRATDGRICRTFTATGMAGLACHGAGQWRVAALAATKDESIGAYRMAASGLPDTIREAAQQMIQGAPFDAAAERQARARDWK